MIHKPDSPKNLTHYCVNFVNKDSPETATICV